MIYHSVVIIIVKIKVFILLWVHSLSSEFLYSLTSSFYFEIVSSFGYPVLSLFQLLWNSWQYHNYGAHNSGGQTANPTILTGFCTVLSLRPAAHILLLAGSTLHLPLCTESSLHNFGCIPLDLGQKMCPGEEFPIQHTDPLRTRHFLYLHFPLMGVVE